MTAQIVDLASARERFGLRASARRDDPASQLEASRRRWLEDLATWPRAVRDVVRPQISSMVVPDHVIAPTHQTLTPWSPGTSAQIADRLSEPGFLRWVIERGYVACVPSAREEPLSADRLLTLVSNACARCDTAGAARRELLWTLWVYGIRKLDRAALAAEARRHVERVLEDIEAHVIHGRFMLDHMRESLARGVVASGKRMGQPLRPTGARAAPLHVANREAMLAEAEAQLAVLVPWARAHPLAFRLGRLPQRMEPIWPPRRRRKGWQGQWW